MNLQFTERNGDRLQWTRDLTIGTPEGDVKGPFMLTMVTVKDKAGAQVRQGRVQSDGGIILWEGRLGMVDAPPLRAFAVAAGLCDESGDSSKLPLPAWVPLSSGG